MVAPDSAETNRVYLYKPNTPSIGLYTMDAYTTSGFAEDTDIRNTNNGVVSVQSVSDYALMIVRYSTDSGQSSDVPLEIDSGEYNKIIWAHGAIWPARHGSSENDRGFKYVYWNDGYCTDVLGVEPASPYYIFLLLLLAIVFNSKYSYFR